VFRAIGLLGLVLWTGCSGEGGDDDDQAGGTVTYNLDGTSYTESSDVSAVSNGAFFSITWNSGPDGDLGEDFYGSLTLSAYSGPGTYAPALKRTDVDAVIEDGSGTTLYPFGPDGNGDGNIIVETDDGSVATGTFSFTGDTEPQTGGVAIEGEFTVTLMPQDG